MANSNGEAAAAAACNINPLLLASARVGSWKALNLLLERRGAQDPLMMIPTEEFLESLVRAEESVAVPAALDLEHGGNPRPASLAAGELLKGVTHDGDTALHAVARNGDHADFMKYAGIIYDSDSGLLFAKNHTGDTPLHCAARAGNSSIVSHLIHLAAREGDDTKLRLLRMENKHHETALHEAVRFENGRILGPKDRKALLDAYGAPGKEKIRAFVGQQEGMTIVKLLMVADPQLANYPADGISPLYLAITLSKSTIALTLYHHSGGNISYSGVDGQNALHAAAVLRDADTGTN